MIGFTLPVPPSTNGLFATGAHGKRYITPKYQAWRDEAMAEIMTQRIGHPVPHGPVAITISMPDSNGKRDLDNTAKAILDCLVQMAVIHDDNDRIVRRLVIQVGGASGRCHVAVEAMTVSIPHEGKVS